VEKTGNEYGEREQQIERRYKRNNGKKVIGSEGRIREENLRSLVSKVTGSWLGDRDSISGMGENFFFATSSRPALTPTQPPIQRVPGSLSQGMNLSKCEVYHSSLFSTKFKNTWSCAFPPSYMW
jgi:hypothetical protein